MQTELDRQNQTSEASLHAFDYWQVLKNRYGVILLTFLLIFMTAAVITYVLPKKYESKAVVQVNPAVLDVDPLGKRTHSPAAGAYLTRSFIPNEFSIIEMEQTLQRVIERLDLGARWNNMDQEMAMRVLKSILKTEQIRGTDLIEIRVRHQSAQDARDIAHAVSIAYKERRESDERKRAKTALQALDNEVRTQEDLVTEKRKLFQTIVKAVGVPYIEDSRWSLMGQSEEQILNSAKRERFEHEKEKRTLEIQIKQLLRLKSEELMKFAAGLNLPDSGVPDLYKRWLDANRNMHALLVSGLGRKHPEVLMAAQVQTKLEEDTRDAVVILQDLLQTKLELVDGELEELRRVVDEYNREAVDKALQSQEYVDAKQDYESAKDILKSLKVTAASKRIELRIPKNPITIHEEPKMGKSPVSPKVTLYLSLGAVVGLVFGIAIAFFLEYLDTSVKSLEDVERYLQVPVLAVIPKDVGVLHKQAGMSPDAEAYRILRTNIEFNRKNPEDNAITIVSGGAGEGKSTTLVNLAYVCAQGGYTTLMIDADLRRPRLHTFFDINNSVGLTNYLTTDLMLEDVILQTPVDNLYFLPSGILPADAAGILNSRRMSELIQDVKQRFDLILVDSPPILGVSDASVLASEVDLTMIVVQHRKLPRNMLMRVKHAVENVGGQVIGVVLNNVDVRSDSQYQYYTSYYTYYAPSADADPVANPGSSPAAAPAAAPSKPAPSYASEEDDDGLY